MMTMTNDQALERIEGAMRETPFCPCGAPAVPVGRSGGVWLECASLQPAKGILRQLLTLDFAANHTRRLIVDLAIEAAAA